MTGAQIKELTDMLAALEQQLQNQNGPSASASDSSSTNPGQITVKVHRERKLRKFAGSRDDSMLEEWIGDTTQAIAGQTDADGMDFLLEQPGQCSQGRGPPTPSWEESHPCCSLQGPARLFQWRTH